MSMTISQVSYGPFRDPFMYKYLSLLLGSFHPTPSIQPIFRNVTVDDPALLTYLDTPYTPAYSKPPVLMENTFSLPKNISDDFLQGPSHCMNCTETVHEYPLPLPHTIAIILAGTLLSILTAGGNLMVIVAFRLERQLQTISNYFLLSLAMADLTVGLTSIPLMTYYTAKGEWDLGYTTCQFWLSIDYWMCNASVMNLLLISFDRYFSVTQPLTYRPRRTSKKAMGMIAGTFVISFLLWPPLIISWPYIEGAFKVGHNECIVQFLRTNAAVTLGTATMAFYGPVVIMVVLYSRVYYVTKTRQHELLKLQAFHQKSIKRTISAYSEAKMPLHQTLSTTTSSTIVTQKVSVYSKNQCGYETDIVYCNNNLGPNRSPTPNRGRPVPSYQVALPVSDSKQWGFQALLDHFTKPKAIESSPSTRRASFASSGFEEEETFSEGSGDDTTMAGEEYFPLRRSMQRGHQNVHKASSANPSDYGSTLTSQFMHYVRNSLLVRRRSKIELKRNPSIMPTNRIRSMSSPHPAQCKLIQLATAAVTNPQRYWHQHSSPSPRTLMPAPPPPPISPLPLTPRKKDTRSRPRRATYDPANSPVREIQRASGAPRSSARCTLSNPTGSKLYSTREENEDIGSENGRGSKCIVDVHRRAVSKASRRKDAAIYNVLIQLGKSDSQEDTSPSIAPPQICIDQTHDKSSITIIKNPSAKSNHLTPDRRSSRLNSSSASELGSAAPSSKPPRRLSSASSALSDPTSPSHLAAPSNINGKRCQSSGSQSPTSTNSSMTLRRQAANRLSSAKSGVTEGTAGQTVSAATSPGQATITMGRSCRSRRRGERRYQESKAARTLSAILLAFIITWAPYNVIVCIESFHAHSVPEFWFTFGYYLCYLNSAVNPLLYALCNPTFRRTFWYIMTCQWKQLKNRHQRRRSPHHQVSVALTAVAIATANRQQQNISFGSFK